MNVAQQDGIFFSTAPYPIHEQRATGCFALPLPRGCLVYRNERTSIGLRGLALVTPGRPIWGLPDKLTALPGYPRYCGLPGGPAECLGGGGSRFEAGAPKALGCERLGISSLRLVLQLAGAAVCPEHTRLKKAPTTIVSTRAVQKNKMTSRFAAHLPQVER